MAKQIEVLFGIETVVDPRHIVLDVGNKYHSTDLLTARGVALLAVHGTSGSTSYETILHIRLETSGDVLSTVDMVT